MNAFVAIEFLRKLRRLLDQGGFVASYKFALLHAIADLCVTRGDDTGVPLRLPLDELAKEYIRLYWRQTTLPPSVVPKAAKRPFGFPIPRTGGRSQRSARSRLRGAARRKAAADA